MFSDQKTTPHGIHIRNQHQIMSIMDILEYLISKKNFLITNPPLVDCVGPKSKNFFSKLNRKTI